VCVVLRNYIIYIKHDNILYTVYIICGIYPALGPESSVQYTAARTFAVWNHDDNNQAMEYYYSADPGTHNDNDHNNITSIVVVHFRGSAFRDGLVIPPLSNCAGAKNSCRRFVLLIISSSGRSDNERRWR